MLGPMRARSVVATLLVAATLFLLGHSTVRALRAQVVQPPPVPPSRNTTEPDRRWLGAETCQASAPRELGRSSVRNLRLHVASQPAGPRTAGSYAHHASTLVAWSTGEHAFTTRAIGAELGPSHEVALDQGINLSVLAPASGGRFLAITLGALCQGATRGNWCVRATGLASDGTAIGTPYAPTPAGQMMELTDTAPLRAADGSPTGVAVAMVSRWGGADITLYRLDGAGQVVLDAHPIRTDGPSESPIERIESEGEQVVAYGTVDERPFVIALGQRRQAIARAVPASARLRYARVIGGELDLFYAQPRGRVRWLRVSGTDGSYVAGTPTTIEPSTPLPTDPILPVLAVARGSLTLTRTDLRGQAVGTPIAIAPARGRTVTAWSWEGESLHVVWGVRSGREWIVSESHVACPPTLDAPAAM